MTWLRQNRFLGTFLIVLGIATLGALVFLWSAHRGFSEAKARFDESAMELNRLQRLTPFPSQPNLQKMKSQAEDYAAELNKLKEELKTRVLSATPMAPNEFQARLRQASTAAAEKARANKVRLPENFYLGFDEFAAALPDTAQAPVLGQQLAQAELLLNILLDARVEALTVFRRVPATEASLVAATPTPVAARRPAAAPSPSPGPKLVERNVIEISFTAVPGAGRRVLNQISTAREQFYIVRTLHAVNEKEKGPPREGVVGAGVSPAGAGATLPPGAAPTTPASALNFIVGNERIQSTARIEMLKFNL